MFKLTLTTLSLFISFSLFAQDYNYYNNLAKEEYDKKNYYNVIDYANKSINASPNGAGYWYRAMGRYGLNNYEDAASDFTTALSYYSSDNTSLGNLYYWRGSCRYNQTRYKDALSDFGSAKNYGYENKLNMYWCMAFASYKTADSKNAKEYYTNAMNYTSDNSTLSQLYKGRGDVAYDQFQMKDAINDYTKAIEYNSNYSTAFWARGIAHAGNFEDELAIADYTSAINLLERENKKENDADLASLYSNRGRLQWLSLKNDEAKSDLVKSLSLDPNNAKANWNMADIYYSLKDYKEATRYYLQAVSLLNKDADKTSCYKSLYQCSINTLDYSKALSYINSAISISQDDGDLYGKRAHIMAVKKDYRASFADYDKAIGLYSNDTYGFYAGSRSSLYAERGRIKLYKLKDNSSALADFQKALKEDTSAYTYYHLGRIHKVLKENEKANSYLKEAIGLATEKDTTSDYIYSKVILGDKNEAINAGVRMIKRDADSKDKLIWDYYNTACVCALAGNPAKAIQYFDKAIAAGFDNYDHIYNDEDWDALRNTPAFKAVLVKYKVPQPKW